MIIDMQRFIPRGRPEFPAGKLTFLQKAEFGFGHYGPCDLCLVADVVNMAKEFYKDEEGWGWNICPACKEELKDEGVI